MAHILRELDIVLFFLLVLQAVVFKNCPQQWGYCCEGMSRKWKYVLETTRTQIPYDTFPKKHNPSPKMHFCFF